MPNKIDKNMFAPCGMNCMVCYVHLKKKKPCSGCLSNGIEKPERCKLCKIKKCTQDKGFTYCYECDEFPCKIIKNLDKSYQQRYQVSLITNSTYVKEKGTESFFREEMKRWTCKKCAGVISLHDKECSVCGKKSVK